jgi:hypothetical protein
VTNSVTDLRLRVEETFAIDARSDVPIFLKLPGGSDPRHWAYN